MLHLPIDLLKTFVAVAEMKNITQAARVLHLTQPAVSLQIKRLEESINRELFIRGSAGMQLNEAGETLLTYARRILSLADEAVARINTDRLSGHIRFGVPSDFAVPYLTEVFAGFIRTYPDVTLEIECNISSDLLDRLGSGQFDVVLAMSDLPAPAVCDFRWREPLAWVLSAATELVRGTSVPLVVYGEGCTYRRRMINTLNQHRIPWRIAMTCPSLSGIHAAVLAGIGVTALSRPVVPAGLEPLAGNDTLPALGEVEIGVYHSLEAETNVASVFRQHLVAGIESVHRFRPVLTQPAGSNH